MMSVPYRSDNALDTGATSMSGLKVAHVITRSDTVGGAQMHVKELVATLLEQGHEAKVFVGQDGVYTGILASAGLPYYSLRHLKRGINPWRDLRAVFELKDALARYAPDLVACHSSKAGWLGRIAAKMLGIPVVFTAHCWAYAEGVSPLRRAVYRGAERVAAPLASRIITVSDYDRRLALRARVARNDQLVTIRNGTEITSPETGALRSGKPSRMIMVARLDSQKNHEDLFQALAQLGHTRWELDIVGDGPLEDHLKTRAASLGIDGQINFLGYRPDVATLLAGAQIFVLASHWEGLPISILEAMQAGLPVVATDVGGVGEAVADGETGFLVPYGDVPALKQAIEQLLDNAELSAEMGRAGRRRYDRCFTLDRMVDETLAVYQGVLREAS